MFEKSILDFIDCHTTIRGPSGRRPTLPCLANAREYNAFQRDLRSSGGAPYSGKTGHKGQIIHELWAGYNYDDFWKYYLNDLGHDQRWSVAWTSFIPLEATLRYKPTVNSGVVAKVVMSTRALLLPVGWSTRTTVTVTGQHTLSVLADLTQELLDRQAITFNGTVMGLRQCHGEIGRMIAADAFFGEDTVEFEAPGMAKVASIAAADGKAVLLKGGLFGDQTKSIQTILGPSSGVRELQLVSLDFQHPETNFIGAGENSRFIYLRKWFPTSDRKQEKILCYHNNTVRSLTLYRHRLRLLEVLLAQQKERPARVELARLARSCIDELRRPSYFSASVRDQVETEDVRKLLNAAAAVFKKGKSGASPGVN